MDVAMETEDGGDNLLITEEKRNLLKNQLMELTVQEETWDEVIAKTKAELEVAEKEYADKLNALCDDTMKFCDDMSDFDDNNGLLSPWWSAQILALQDPAIQHTAAVRRQTMLKNDEMYKSIKLLTEERDTLLSKIGQIEENCADNEKKLGELREECEFLQQEPFCLEFRSMKATIQASREKSIELRALVAKREIELGKPQLLQTAGLNSEPNANLNIKRPFPVSTQKEERARRKVPNTSGPSFKPPSDVDKDAINEVGVPTGGYRLFKMYEKKTTVVYRKQTPEDGQQWHLNAIRDGSGRLHPSYSDSNLFHPNGDHWPLECDDEDNFEVSHS